MPTPTYVALAKTVLTGSQATITFNSIPQTYTDLILLVSARCDQAADYRSAWITINSLAANYSDTYVYGSGTSVGSGNASTQAKWTDIGVANGTTSTSNTFSSFEAYFPNYTGNSNKIVSSTAVVELNSTSGNILIPTASLVGSSTTAISSITITLAAGNYVSGSRFDLYGIKNS